jgi:hypothetical protein
MELKRRAEEDEMFRQVMHVHQETVDSYLEDVILESIDASATTQARQEMQVYMESVDQLISGMPQDHELTVEDLVSSFLIPHVEKEVVRHQGNRHTLISITILFTQCTSTS